MEGDGGDNDHFVAGMIILHAYAYTSFNCLSNKQEQIVHGMLERMSLLFEW